MNRREFLDLLSRKVLVMDGGLATLLLADKIPGPGFCPEVFLLESMDEVVAVHARYARSGADLYVREGARLIGGCCGTTPAHISALRRALV